MAATEKKFHVSCKRDVLKENYISMPSPEPVDCEFKLVDFPKMDNVQISKDLDKLPFPPDVR